jgi:hypothetical protein
MKVDNYPSGGLKELAAELPEWLAVSDLPVDGVSLASVALAVWDVKPGSGLGAALQSSDWHHQLQKNSRPLAYARSRIINGSARVIEVTESPLAAELDTALGSLKSGASGDMIARILRSERHHTTVLWIHHSQACEELVVLQSPFLPAQQRLDERSFLESLAAADVAGLANPRPQLVARAVPMPAPADTADVDMWQLDRRSRLVKLDSRQKRRS